MNATIWEVMTIKKDIERIIKSEQTTKQDIKYYLKECINIRTRVERLEVASIDSLKRAEEVSFETLIEQLTKDIEEYKEAIVTLNTYIDRLIERI